MNATIRTAPAAFGLPIDAALPALRTALAAQRHVVLQAPPGAGKSTAVPLALLDEPWMHGRRILVQEPRRLAARAVAERMAATMGSAVGQLIGLRMRLDTRVSRATRIEVVTEGVLTRMLQDDPALEGVGAVLFDEFHERSLASDLALTLALDAGSQLDSATRLLVMSATLDGERIAALLGNAPIVTCEARRFAVEVRHLGRGAPLLPGAAAPPEALIMQTILRALREEPGDLLVFLPGAGEIRRVEAGISGAAEIHGVDVRALYGDLSLEAQRAAIAPSPAGRRRVVLATNIAETSLTIEGVRVVIDCGLVRRSVFDPVTGMDRLETQRISRASAEQRAGRAGRVAPGVCYRLWSAGAERSLAPFTAPEILEADLAPLALELAAWGAGDARALRWLDSPPDALLASARDLLVRLGALDTAGRITAHGRAMAGLPAHPRLAHMLLQGRRRGGTRLACELAALLSERDLLRASGSPRNADIAVRIAALRGEAFGALEGANIDHGVRPRVRRTAEQFERLLARDDCASRDVGGDPPDEGVLLAFAYPDRIGRSRAGAGGRYMLANGRGAHFSSPDSLAREEFIVAVELDDRDRDARILLAAALARADLEQHFADRMRQVEEIVWDAREEAVAARRCVMLDGLTIEARALVNADPEATAAAMLQGVRQLGVDALPWSPATRALQARMEFVRRLGRTDVGNWPEVGDSALAATFETWLPAWLGGMTRRSHLARLPLADALRSRLDHRQQQQLAELAPEHLKVPSGSNIRIDYQDDNAPCVAVKLQEMFGAPETPRVGGGSVPVTFKLLSPAQRPLQITRDLASFWRNAYADVRKGLRGRYPRHYWPENPLEAAPTRGARRPKSP